MAVTRPSARRRNQERLIQIANAEPFVRSAAYEASYRCTVFYNLFPTGSQAVPDFYSSSLKISIS
jgi:hypothetical protein